MSGDATIFAALDTTDPAVACDTTNKVREHVGGVKLGLEFFMANGPDGVRQVASEGLPVFLDLKLHDIPNTVAGAVRAVLELRPAMLTIHASGGPKMLRAAAEAAASAGAERPKVLAVTVLTSLDDIDLAALGHLEPVQNQVMRCAALAKECGLDGVICSPWETSAMRKAFGPDFMLVVPGIRPVGTDAGDQKRTMTPGDAVAAGADVLVIGRPITAAPDPVSAAREISHEMAI